MVVISGFVRLLRSPSSLGNPPLRFFLALDRSFIEAVAASLNELCIVFYFRLALRILGTTLDEFHEFKFPLCKTADDIVPMTSTPTTQLAQRAPTAPLQADPRPEEAPKSN